MPRVELSITDLGPVIPPPRDPLGHWMRAVGGAVEPCLVIDKRAVIVAMSFYSSIAACSRRRGIVDLTGDFCLRRS